MIDTKIDKPLKLSFSTDPAVDVTALDRLFVAIGWKARGAEKWQEVLSKSTFVVTLWNEKQLVGLGRILEDGVMCMFYDIGIHPEYQGRGFGRQIMQALIDHVKDRSYASIGLFAWEENPANIPFYKKFGFECMTSGMELVRYMKRE